MPVPLPPKDGLAALANEVKEDSDEGSTPAPSTSTEFEYGSEESSKPIFIPGMLEWSYKIPSTFETKAELRRDYKEKLASKKCVVTHYRKHNMHLSTVFIMDGPLRYCNNIKRLFKKSVEEHKASEWRLFLHSSKKSLKAVFLHNGKIKQSVPVAHSMHLKDS